MNINPGMAPESSLYTRFSPRFGNERIVWILRKGVEYTSRAPTLAVPGYRGEALQCLPDHPDGARNSEAGTL